MGSLVASERLRFDFSHFASLEPEHLREIESMVNDRVRAGLEVSTFEENLEKAREMGAQALFGEKYEDRVRVVRIGDFSLELCGGTHVDSTAEIGLFHIAAEGGIAAGIRRVEAFTGQETEQIMRSHHRLLLQMSNLLNVLAADLPQKLEGLLHRNRELEGRLEALQRQDARQRGIELAAQAQEMEKVRVLAARVEVEEAGALRTLADNLREHLGSGLGVVGTVLNGKVSLIAVVTPDLIETRGLNAGDIVKRVARLVGGSGGGKPHLARAGGKDAEKLDQALAAVPGIVKELLAE
jgi:alanyl-tRNA synthetase